MLLGKFDCCAFMKGYTSIFEEQTAEDAAKFNGI